MRTEVLQIPEGKTRRYAGCRMLYERFKEVGAPLRVKFPSYLMDRILDEGHVIVILTRESDASVIVSGLIKLASNDQTSKE